MPNSHETDFRPAQFLVDNVELLPRGQALDVAMVSGQNAVYLAKMAFGLRALIFRLSQLTMLWNWRERLV